MSRFGQLPDHERCTATAKASGEQCKRSRLTGLSVCQVHGGGAKHAREAGQRRRAQEKAAAAVESLSIPVDTTPEDALLGEVRHVAGDVAFLRQQVRALGEDITQEVITSEFGGYQAPSVWMDMYWQAHDRLVRVAGAAIKAGVEERRVRVAERQLDAVMAAMHATFEELGVEVTPEVAQTVGRHLRAVS